MSAAEGLGEVAAVIAAHVEEPHVYSWPDGRRGRRCSCKRDLWSSEHVAEALAPLIDARERRAAESALREAANRWTQGAWSDVMLPKPTPPAIPVIAYANRVGDWLRERADTLAEETPCSG